MMKAQYSKYVLAIIVLLFIGHLALIYVIGVETNYLISITRATRLPAAEINGNIISFSEFYGNLDSARNIPDASGLSDSELRLNVWKKMKREYAVRDIADEMNIVISDDQINRFVSALLNHPDNASDIVLQQQYVDSEESFKYHIIEPLLLESQITRELLVNGDSDMRQYAEMIRAKASADPEQFDILLEQHLEDQNDLDAITNITLSQTELEAAELDQYIGHLLAGDISSIVASYDGYRIFKVEKIFDEEERVWYLKELFIPANPLDDRINEQLSQSKNKIFAERFLQISE